MLAQTGVASLSYLKKLSARWRWKERASVWQAQLVASSQVDDAELTVAVRERQLRDARALQQLARAQLARWLQQDEQGTLRLIKRLTPHQVARFWQAGSRLERELLPPPEEGQVPEWDSYRRQDDRQHQPSPRVPSLPQALSGLLVLLRKAGLRGKRLDQARAKLLRWLWLREDAVRNPEPLSLTARKKASSQRKRDHGH
jgi:hypothetical protein